MFLFLHKYAILLRKLYKQPHTAIYFKPKTVYQEGANLWITEISHLSLIHISEPTRRG